VGRRREHAGLQRHHWHGGGGACEREHGHGDHVTGGFSNIQALTGNDSGASANTTLTGTDTGSTYTINAANGGDVNDGVARSRQRGGQSDWCTGADTFQLVNDGATTFGALSGAIDGGATASNTLDYSGTMHGGGGLASASTGTATNVTVGSATSRR